MALFTGKFDCKLDAKGRIALPSKVKSKLPEIMGNQLVLSEGLEPCLVLYTALEHRKILSQVASLSEFDTESRLLQRTFYERIAEVDLDSAGRILIPKTMSQTANLKKEVMLIGMGNRMELWDPESYKEHIVRDKEEFSKLVQKHLTER